MPHPTHPPGLVASAFAAFRPRRLMRSPVIFATVLAGILIGLLDAADLVEGGRGAGHGLELVVSLFLIALVANFIEALAARSDRSARRR